MGVFCSFRTKHEPWKKWHEGAHSSYHLLIRKLALSLTFAYCFYIALLPCLSCSSFVLQFPIVFPFFFWRNSYTPFQLYLFASLQNTKDNWWSNSNESNLFYNIRNGWWLGWGSWWNFKIETIDNLPLEKLFLGQDWERQRRSNGPWKHWFWLKWASNTALFLARTCLCCGDTIFASFHINILWVSICGIPSPGNNPLEHFVIFSTLWLIMNLSIFCFGVPSESNSWKNHFHKYMSINLSTSFCTLFK